MTAAVSSPPSAAPRPCAGWRRASSGRRAQPLAHGLRAFFLVLTDALLRFGGGGTRALLSLVDIVLFVVPLVTLVLGTIYLYNAREFTELLLAQPVRRRAVFGGLYIGLVLPLMLAFVGGVGVPFALRGGSRRAGARGRARRRGAADAGVRRARAPHRRAGG